MEHHKTMLCVQDISERLGISISMSYRIIRELNAELKKKGYLTIAGRVSRAYFEEKIYAHDKQEN